MRPESNLRNQRSPSREFRGYTAAYHIEVKYSFSGRGQPCFSREGGWWRTRRDAVTQGRLGRACSPGAVDRAPASAGQRLGAVFVCVLAFSQSQPGQHLVGGDGARRARRGMDLARSSRHDRALRRIRDPPLAGVLGDLHPPASADGLGGGCAPLARLLDTCADRVARGAAAAILHHVRRSPGLPQPPL